MSYDHRADITALLTGISEEMAPEKLLGGRLEELLQGVKPERILCLGKASASLARGTSALLPGTPGLSYGVGTPGPLPPGWRNLAGDHPLPTRRNLKNTEIVISWVGAGTGPLLVLISGGTSSLLTSPIPPWTLQEKSAVTTDLLLSGATIGEINAVRMRISGVKGGGLRGHCGRRRVFTGVWSDVERREFRIVGSAPTLSVPAAASADEIAALHSIELPRDLPPDRLLRRVPPGDRYRLLFDGRDLEGAVYDKLRGIGIPAVRLCIPEGEGVDAAARRLRRAFESAKGRGPRAFVSVGEAPCSVGRKGRGGRCSHLAARIAQELNGRENWSFWAVATDGVDGTGEGGAAVHWDRLPDPGEIRAALERCDTGTLWRRHGASIPGKPTGNNLRDLRVLLAGG